MLGNMRGSAVKVLISVTVFICVGFISWNLAVAQASPPTGSQNTTLPPKPTGSLEVLRRTLSSFTPTAGVTQTRGGRERNHVAPTSGASRHGHMSNRHFLGA